MDWRDANISWWYTVPQRDGRGRVRMLLTWLWEHQIALGEDWLDVVAEHLSVLVIEEFRRLSQVGEVGLVAKIDRYLTDCLHYPIGLEEIALAFDVSQSHLVKCYRDETGVTPTKDCRPCVSNGPWRCLPPRTMKFRTQAAVSLASAAHLNVLLKRHAGGNASTIRKQAMGDRRK